MSSVVCCSDGVAASLEAVVLASVVCDSVVAVGCFISEVVVVAKGKDGVEFDNSASFFAVSVVSVCASVVVTA